MKRLRSLLKKLETRAEGDSRFADRAIAVLAAFLAEEAVPARRRLPMEALTTLKPAQYAREHGPEELRRYLERFTTNDLRAYVRTERLSQSGVSKLGKDDVINRIIVAARSAA